MLLSVVRAGLITRLETIPALTGQVKKSRTSITTPMAVVAPTGMAYHGSFGRGQDDPGSWEVEVVVGLADADAAVDMLDGFMSGHGANSVRAALETSTGVADPINDVMVRVRECQVGADNSPDLAQYLVATFSLDLSIPGT
jgi:hypothetical protein